MSSNNKILKIYNSRKIILDILNIHQDYDIKDYENFSINEIDAMFTNNQLDMLVKGEESDKKIYIKYYLNSKNIRKENLETLVEDLFQIESVLEKADTLIIIINEEPNDTILERIKYLYDHDGIFIVLHNIDRLQFNILEHHLVPYIRILNENEVDDLKKKYNLKDTMQLPEISRFDPQALAICLRPGDVCSLERKSNTAMLSRYYRVCV